MEVTLRSLHRSHPVEVRNPQTRPSNEHRTKVVLPMLVFRVMNQIRAKIGPTSGPGGEVTKKAFSNTGGIPEIRFRAIEQQ
jgi:hypothetical protein